MAVDLLEGSHMPLRDAGMGGEPVLLRGINFLDSPASVGRDGLSAPAVVGSVAEHLGELSRVLEGAAMIRVLGVGLHQLVERRRVFLGDDVGIKQVHIHASEHGGYPVRFICFSYNYLEVSSVQIHIKESKAGIRAIHATYVRKGKIHRPPRCRLA